MRIIYIYFFGFKYLITVPAPINMIISVAVDAFAIGTFVSLTTVLNLPAIIITSDILIAPSLFKSHASSYFVSQTTVLNLPAIIITSAIFITPSLLISILFTGEDVGVGAVSEALNFHQFILNR